MYVWGGGWNESDTGAGREACTLGISPRWSAFAQKQTACYDFHTTRYQIHDGLDCSGYVGWCLYNLFHTPLPDAGQHFTHSHAITADADHSCIHAENASRAPFKDTPPCGYVMPAYQMAASFAARGWGAFIPSDRVTDYHTGDIMSTRGHVWIAVGQCSDGSIVLLHSSPPGVRLCGTPRSAKTTAIRPIDSQAIRLASHYMRTYYPDWYSRYPDCSCDNSYLRDYDQMRWDTSGNSVLTDPDGFQQMSAASVLENLFHQ